MIPQLQRTHLPSVCTWQSVCGAVVPVDLELLDATHPFESSEALQRHLGGPRHKLEEPCSVRLVKGAQSTPEPLNLRRDITINTAV